MSSSAYPPGQITAESNGQKLVVAKSVADAVGFQHAAGHRGLVETHMLMRATLEADLRDLEAEW